MNMIKGRSRAISTTNDERHQVLPSRVIWDGSIDRFEVYRNNVEGHYGQIGAGYLFDTGFQTAYLESGIDCYVDFMDEVPSASQIKKDARALYGALLSACQGGVGHRILMENRGKQDGIRSWYQLVNQFETDAIRMSELRFLKTSSQLSSIDIIKEDCLNGYKTMKMHSQNLVHLVKQLGMMMILRNVVWSRMLKILVWLTLLLKL
jgi:hypothetical protein